MSRVVIVSVILFLSGCRAGGGGHVHAEPSVVPVPRTISVSGKAEIRTAPDEFVITVGVQSFNKDLAAAKADNDTRSGEVLVAVKGFGVEAKDVRTDDFRIQPR